MDTPVILQLLSAPDWGTHQPLVNALRCWWGWPIFEESVRTLNRSALFESFIHGPGHIERTLCHGAFCAMEEGLNDSDTRLLLLACSYHDVGRINDGLDDLHGYRAAAQIPALTGLEGEELNIVQAAVHAHSQSDSVLRSIVERYNLPDFSRGLTIAELLKDADGLDRVRIWDLDPAYLRRDSSRARAPFAKELYLRYQAATSSKPVPDFVRKWKHLDENGVPLDDTQ